MRASANAGNHQRNQPVVAVALRITEARRSPCSGNFVLESTAVIVFRRSMPFFYHRSQEHDAADMAGGLLHNWNGNCADLWCRHLQQLTITFGNNETYG